MIHEYPYVIYDDLRRNALGLFKSFAAGKSEGNNLFHVKKVSDTLVLSLNSNPINNNLYIHQIPPVDLAKVLKEAICELSTAEIENLQKSWRFMEIEPFGNARWLFSDLAKEWKSAPQRITERREKEQAIRNLRKAVALNRSRRWASLPITRTVIGILLTAIGGTLILRYWPSAQEEVGVYGSVASIVGLCSFVGIVSWFIPRRHSG